MFGLLLKKTTVEIWDNAVLIFLLNLAFSAAALALVMGMVELAPRMPLLSPLILLVGAGLLFYALIAGTRLVLACAAHREPDRWWHEEGLAMATVIAVAALAGLFAAVPALAGAGRATGGVAGNALMLTACWLALLWLACLLFSAPVMIISGGRPVEAARLLALLLLDNPIFALACTLLAIPALLLTFGLLPGPFGLALFATNAVQLRFSRYQNASPGRPDWTMLLADERAALARRRPLSVIFPWRA